MNNKFKNHIEVNSSEKSIYNNKEIL